MIVRTFCHFLNGVTSSILQKIGLINQLWGLLRKLLSLLTYVCAIAFAFRCRKHAGDVTQRIIRVVTSLWSDTARVCRNCCLHVISELLHCKELQLSQKNVFTRRRKRTAPYHALSCKVVSTK